MIEGLDARSSRPFSILNKLGGAAVPKQRLPITKSTTLAHCAGEWKGQGRNMGLAKVQASFDGAAMTYGRGECRTLMESPDPAGHAYIHTFTIDGHKLHTFCHYASQAQHEVEYHICTTSVSALTREFEDGILGRRRLRNLQDLAKDNCEALRDELNAKWAAPHPPLIDTDALATPPETTGDTSPLPDPDAEFDQSDQHSQKRSLRPKPPKVDGRNTRKKTKR